MAPMVGVVGLTGQSVFLRTPNLPLEGETVLCDALYLESGGKGHNQSITCGKMGVKALFVGSVGDDAWAEACRNDLGEAGVTPLLSVYEGEKTAFAAICVDHLGRNQVACYVGAGMSLRPQDIAKHEVLTRCQVLLTQLEIGDDCVREVLSIGHAHRIPVVLNPAPARQLPLDLLRGFYALTPNEHEAKVLFGIDPSGEHGISALAAGIIALGLPRVAVTLGGKGALLVEAGQVQHIPPLPVKQVLDTTGAGDTFSGALAAGLAQGAGFADAARFAVAASGLSVLKQGAATSIPTRQAVEACRFDKAKGQWSPLDMG